MRKISPFILCGGAGTRLWPLSREAFPKQFHKILGKETLFQQACQRVQGDLFGPLSVLSSHQHRFLITEQLEEIGVSAADIVLEPVGRNTAAAACVAALIGSRADPNTLILLVPADHVIADPVAFTRTIELGAGAAEGGALVTFGVKPDCPHTGYGYIETENSKSPDFKVKRFVEKPSREAAEKFLDSRAFYWNAGIFLCRAAMLVSLLETYAPAILAACRRSLEQATKDLGFLRLNDAFVDAPAISLDYAVAEKAHNLRCVPLNTLWSDVGSWAAVWSALEKDGAGNAVLAEGDFLPEGTSNSLVYSDQASVALAGLKDVATEDAVLVASRDYVGHVKDIVEHLKDNDSPNAFDYPAQLVQAVLRGKGKYGVLPTNFMQHPSQTEAQRRPLIRRLLTCAAIYAATCGRICDLSSTPLYRTGGVHSCQFISCSSLILSLIR